MGEIKYVLRFFFDMGGCLWSGNDAAYQDFDYGPYDLLDPCPLPLTTEVIQRCVQMSDWHDTSFNQDSQSDPGPWRQAECDRFNAATEALLADIRRQLGPNFHVEDQQIRAVEDPNLDAYLANLKRFRR